MKIPAPAIALLLLAYVRMPAADLLPFPAAEKKPVIDSYFGVDVLDNYQWMENIADPAVKAFATAQNDRTRHFLDAIPERTAIKATLTKWYDALTMNYSGLVESPAGLFANKMAPPKEQPVLVLLPTADDPSHEKILLDPTALDPTGATAIDWWKPSPDGRLLAVCLSKNGSEDGTLYFYDVATGKALPDSIPRVQYPTGGGSVAWFPKNEAVYYTRYPAPGERPEADQHFFQQIWRHKLGDDIKKDTYVLGKDFPRIAEIKLASAQSGFGILATVSNGDGGDYAHYLCQNEEWSQITHFEDGIKKAILGKNNDLFLLSRKEAPTGKILRLLLNTDLKKAAPQLLVPESDAVIQDIVPAADAIYLRDLIGGPSQIRRIALDGRQTLLTTPPVTAVRQMLALEDGSLLVHIGSYLAPSAWFLEDPVKNSLHPTALAATSPVDFSDIEIERIFAPAKDGAKIPINILKRKGLVLDGTAPTILYGYGGYGINLEPSFDFTRKLWLERGGIYAIANLRGGGEYGEAWHKAGNLTHKQTVFDDFATCARHLIDLHYTSPARLAIQGGSNGGLLMGAQLTQHPELFRAVVSYVGIYDALRTELEPNGAFNITEFGTVKDRAQFNALHAYSPYHHITAGTKYPSLLLTTGLHDGRVAAWHSLKFAAALQEATASTNPVLLRVNFGAGHGLGTALSTRIDETADVYAFLIKELGVPAAGSVP